MLLFAIRSCAANGNSFKSYRRLINVCVHLLAQTCNTSLVINVRRAVVITGIVYNKFFVATNFLAASLFLARLISTSTPNLLWATQHV